MTEPQMPLAEAVAECAKWGNLVRALARVQDAAQAVAALEQNIHERKELLARLIAECDEARAAHNGHVERARKLVQDAEREIELAQERATVVIADGQRAADAQREKAEAAKADAQAWAYQAKEAEERVVAAETRLREVNAKIEAARAEALRRFGS